MISRLSFVCVALCALVAALPVRAQKMEYLYGVRSAIVEYQTTTVGSGINSTGTETFWFDSSGSRYARLDKKTNTTKVFGRTKTEVSENLSLLLDGWIYNADLTKKTGMKMSLEQAKKMADSFGKQKGAQGAQSGQAYAKEFVERNGGRWLAPEVFLGRTCEVCELWGFKTWTYKGVMLKSEGTVMGVKSTTVATRFEENASMPAGRFDLPKGVKFEEMPDMSALLGGLMAGQPPPGADNDEEAAPAPKPVKKPAPKKPVVDEEAPAPVVKPKPAPKGDGVKLNSTEFGALIGKIRVPGYTAMAPESAGGGHTVNLLNTRGGALVVTVLPLSVADGLEASGAFKVDSKFDYQGHAAISGIRADPFEGDSSIVLVRYPERKLALLLSSNPVQSKEELLKLLEQIAL
ncbi:MAG: hypothetical protein IPL39_13820 [Opitutaceae bacterium]|nr:hypothetical protein [Opitutaceae bacterium]